MSDVKQERNDSSSGKCPCLPAAAFEATDTSVSLTPDVGLLGKNIGGKLSHFWAIKIILLQQSQDF